MGIGESREGACVAAAAGVCAHLRAGVGADDNSGVGATQVRLRGDGVGETRGVWGGFILDASIY